MRSIDLKKAMVVWASISAVIICAGLGTVACAGKAADRGAGDPVYRFTGRGRAHGVGMCMDGVLYRAKAGEEYHAIINYYYTGIKFGRTDENRPIRVKGRDGQVRVLPMKQYLYRLAEEPESYPAQGLRVLYVAARTYVLSCIARRKHAAEGFDVCASGNCCQAFDENKDITKYPNNCAAVDATAGEIITFGENPIIAAYCGSCGGHTENSEDVWSSRIPYLRGKSDTYCQYSSRFAWTSEERKSQVEARLNAAADTRVGTLVSMDLSNRTPGGRVAKARLVGSAGTKVVSGTTLSGRLGLQSSMFDLAGGATDNYDEYILVLNPNSEKAVLAFTFMQPDGTTGEQVMEVAGNSRFTLKVNDYVQGKEVSTKINSDRPVVAERAMYFDNRGRCGGSDSTGVTSPSARWYFAEGYTGGSADTYILVENPQQEAAGLRYTFMTTGGKVVEKQGQAGPCSRVTVHVDDVPGLSNTDFSTVVESTNGVGIVAERSTYFDNGGRDGGNSEAGAPAPATRWYLAEGCTGGKFDTNIPIQNPGTQPAVIDATFMKEDGTNIKKTYDVPPHSRYTIPADGIKGLENAGFSTMLASPNRVAFVAERTMYFNYGGLAGGHDSRGITGPGQVFYFAEGYTGEQFDTYVLVQNPDAGPAAVRATFTGPGGVAVAKDYTIKPKSRLTIPVDGIPGLSDSEVSTTVRSTNGVGVIAERSMYFNYTAGGGERTGGHCTNGVTTPSTQWYFAEGYTGI